MWFPGDGTESAAERGLDRGYVRGGGVERFCFMFILTSFEILGSFKQQVDTEQKILSHPVRLEHQCVYVNEIA